MYFVSLMIHSTHLHQIQLIFFNSNHSSSLQQLSIQLFVCLIDCCQLGRSHQLNQSILSTLQSIQNDSFLSPNEAQSIKRLISITLSLHNDLLLSPGSYLLIQFYKQIQELPNLLTDSQRQASLLSLLNELMYLEDGHSPLLPPTEDHSAFKKLHEYISLLQFLPLFPSGSLIERLQHQQGHPLMKLLLETEGINSVIDETSSDSDPNVVVVGTYNDISPNYYDVRICHCVHSSISFSLNSILLVFLLIVFLQAVLSPQESFSIHLSHLL